MSWPSAFKLGELKSVVVRIAANDYEDIIADIQGADRELKMENFKGQGRLEVTLTSDSGLEVVRHHSDVQVVERGRRHREWL